MWPIFNDGNFTCQHDLIAATLVYNLKKMIGENRLLVTPGLVHGGVINQGLTADYKDDFGTTKKESFMELCKNDYELLKPTIKTFLKKINLKK